MVDRNDKRFFDFACSCSEKDMKKWEGVYEEVRDSFRYREDKNKDRLFISSLVYELQSLDHGIANIEHIYTDMWSGIAVRYQYDYQEKLECEDEEGNLVRECNCEKDPKYDCEWTNQDFWIECDQIHHGLARAYQLVKEFDEKLGVDK